MSGNKGAVIRLISCNTKHSSSFPYCLRERRKGLRSSDKVKTSDYPKIQKCTNLVNILKHSIFQLFTLLLKGKKERVKKQ
jgi:hypothetical protein